MIYDLIKNGEYKQFRMVTFIKDFVIVWCVFVSMVLTLGLCVSFILWIDWLTIVWHSETFGMYFRISFVLAFVISVFVNVRSHTIEIHKMQSKG